MQLDIVTPRLIALGLQEQANKPQPRLQQLSLCPVQIVWPPSEGLSDTGLDMNTDASGVVSTAANLLGMGASSDSRQARSSSAKINQTSSGMYVGRFPVGLVS